jgi:hypothetical protein
MTDSTSRRIEQLMGVLSPVYRFLADSSYARHQGEPGIYDFAIGNPHELALPGFVGALERQVPPQNNDWYGYPQSRPEAQASAARTLSEVVA